MIRKLLPFALLVLLAGCGFHPRGTLAVADGLGPVRVAAADPYSPLAYELATALRRAGATPAADGQPGATVQVLEEKMHTRPLTVDAVVRVREYETRYTVRFEVRGADGQVRVPAQEVELSRDYTYDALQPAGSPAEQELLQEELRRDMVAAILRRIDAVLRAD
ncbi:LPS assembly lipoprotein LptE [Arenimonas composti]|uniref:LPS-assembly lipoprotein LptE n=1 Tax=Arenimonas composti TR7-09 = DSM 18010 TaxID=1121013 RepID=A0A091BDP9_9GAMM|nr:LPS assembly lipoprotein LptE [Arenimonas composti]KFN49657.1 hypothetical protein P873_09830 [Arenimonas composti TR7-09 = DSM 18010]